MAALARAEARLDELRARLAELEGGSSGSGGNGAAEGLLRELRALRAALAADTERALAAGARVAALRAEVEAAAAANAKLRYQNAHLRRAAEGGEAGGGGEAALAAAKAEGGRPALPIDVVPLREMTRERFRDEYQRPNRPVVLRDALAEWPASGKWSIPWFREHYGDADVEVSLDGAQAGAKNHCKLGEYIDSLGALRASAAAAAEAAGGEGALAHYAPYLRAWQYEENHPELSDDFLVKGGWLRKYFPDKLQQLPKHIQPPLTFIFIGPAGACSKLHSDVWHTSAWLAQLQGRKHFTFFHPDHVRLVHNETHGWADPAKDAAANAATHKYYYAAQPFTATIGPGDLIFIPSKWPHQVTSLDDAVSVTSNYVSAARGPLLGFAQSCKKNLLHRSTSTTSGSACCRSRSIWSSGS